MFIFRIKPIFYFNHNMNGLDLIKSVYFYDMHIMVTISNCNIPIDCYNYKIV